MPEKGLESDTDGICRCGWGASDPLYRAYHDVSLSATTLTTTLILE